ncbi:MAG: site-specific integrase, partial [Moraxellaceae bacterium]|nr:site-specific integrase [Moraxellaceae bacterium]
EIMLNGKRLSATRDTPKECEQWATTKILEFKAGKQSHSQQTLLFSELLTLYNDKVGDFKKNHKQSRMFARCFIRDYPNIASKQTHEITPQDLTNWRNSRLAKVKDSTVRREISYFSAVFSYAVKELFIIASNPFSQVQKPSAGKPRNRRISDNEVAKILHVAEYHSDISPTQTRHYVAWCFLFAIETAMRRGEILSIKKDNIFNNYIHLPTTKNGESRNIPLSSKSKHLLSLIDNDSEYLIPVTINSFQLSWKRLLKKSDLVDLHFHDTRHEAISRFVENVGLPVEKLAKITGHKDIKTLVNVYYNPTIDDLANALG